MLSIQALVFTSDPLHNEPGFEKEKGIRNINYNILLTYENFKTAIHKMIVNPPMTFEYFNSITIKHFIENYEKIMEKVESNMDKNEKSYFLNFYNMSDKLNYIGLKKNLSDLHTNIIELN